MYEFMGYLFSMNIAGAQKNEQSVGIKQKTSIFLKAMIRVRKIANGVFTQ